MRRFLPNHVENLPAAARIHIRVISKAHLFLLQSANAGARIEEHILDQLLMGRPATYSSIILVLPTYHASNNFLFVLPPALLSYIDTYI